MNKQLSKLLDKLMAGSESKTKLVALETLFNQGIPFNIPHKFKFVEISHQKTVLKLPYIKKNKNHLGGLHACAVATLGEYPAGLTLVKKFGMSRYRLIMRRIQVEYFKQAKEALLGEVIVNHQELDQFGQQLQSEDMVEVEMTTNILNKSEEVIAVVHTVWQIKNWKKVSFKG
ncbi:MAG: DUF4442 domain-containing protein [Halobacteriovoraceae bacterium]|nr:DUF4442 domain-containing protein [Halobacteriovoraceae bacterium]|tara:strand:+ start:5085 stop:5603 length:519 start_codon:yes stop_codon:yes gene_type:complete